MLVWRINFFYRCTLQAVAFAIYCRGIVDLTEGIDR